jgi:hypothetical protein
VFVAVLLAVSFEIVYMSKKKMGLNLQLTHVGALVPKGQSDGQAWGPRGIVSDRKGDWYYLDGADPQWRIQKFAADMRFVTRYKPSKREGIIQNAVALACGPEGLYVLQSIGGIKVLSPDLSYLRTIATGMEGAVSLDIDTKGNIFVLDGVQQKVFVLNPKGTVLRSFGKPGSGKNALANPVCLAVDAKDNLFVAEAMGEKMRVKSFSPEGVLGNSFIVDLMPTPYSSFGVDQSGRLYFSDLAQEKGVRIYSTQGDYLGAAKSSTDNEMFPNQGYLAVNKWDGSVIIGYASAVGKFIYSPKH